MSMKHVGMIVLEHNIIMVDLTVVWIDSLLDNSMQGQLYISFPKYVKQ